MIYYSWKTSIELYGVNCELEIKPEGDYSKGEFPKLFHITIDKTFFGLLSPTPKGWKIDTDKPKEIIDQIGEMIIDYYL